MSMFYSPELVRFLNDERLREVQEARLAAELPRATRSFKPAHLVGSVERSVERLIGRQFASRSAAQTTCATCTDATRANSAASVTCAC
jgi:hypothetical protein